MYRAAYFNNTTRQLGCLSSEFYYLASAEVHVIAVIVARRLMIQRT